MHQRSQLVSNNYEKTSMEDSDDIDTQENQPTTASVGQAPKAAPEWKPITAKQRRVLGTLMEKSKTTPDAYPMTFAGLCTGCNQKSNRAPISNYSSEQVETIVDELRAIGALTIVQGLGRNTKVRHYAYNWLAISKVEAAVMTELLLRGEQTLGELRTRAARMEPINDLQHMTDLFNELKRRNLVVELSPPGRGQIVSHNLYPEWELEQVRKSVAAGISASSDSDEPASSVGRSASHSNAAASTSANLESSNRIKELETEIVELKESISDLQTRLSRLEKDLGVI
jgi:uncharacterized protein YceH (UPF0502 family)